MQRAFNQSGFAPADVTEYHLGTLPVGSRFVLYGRTRAGNITGTLRRSHECACTVELAPRRVTINATDLETGEAQEATFERHRVEAWSWETPVGLTEAYPNSDTPESCLPFGESLADA